MTCTFLIVIVVHLVCIYKLNKKIQNYEIVFYTLHINRVYVSCNCYFKISLVTKMFLRTLIFLLQNSLFITTEVNVINYVAI